MLPAYLDLPRCDEVSERLSEFLDGELDESWRSRVVLHLAICGACARFASELAVTVQALHGLASNPFRPPRAPSGWRRSDDQ